MLAADAAIPAAAVGCEVAARPRAAETPTIEEAEAERAGQFLTFILKLARPH